MYSKLPNRKPLFPSLVTITEKVGLAIIPVAENGFLDRMFEIRGINALEADFD